jgi:hypothetical protein
MSFRWVTNFDVMKIHVYIDFTIYYLVYFPIN